jgi:hypothetical protein
MKTLLASERFGEAVSRHLVRNKIWRLAKREVLGVESGDPPLLLRARPGFTELLEGLHALPEDLQDLDALSRRPELSQLRRTLDVLSDRLYPQLRLHIEMAAEALELLPPARRTVYWGDRAIPGELDDPSDDSPVYGLYTITMPFFRSTTSDLNTALDFLQASAVPLEGTHRALVQVADSTGRDIFPFSVHPDEQEVLYPPGAVFGIVSRSIQDELDDDGDIQDSYELIEVEEEQPPRS